MKARTARGFTLIELMLTIAVLATLLALAAPSFRSLIMNNRLTTMANQFVGDLNLARIEAIKRSTSVTITAAGGGGTANEFGNGWTVWLDENDNGTMEAAERIRVTDPLEGNVALDSNGDITEITFRRNGAQPTGSVTQTFTLCDNRTGETGRQISVSTVGRVSIDDVACP